MSGAVETVERAIVFEDVSGSRRQDASRCVNEWLSSMDVLLLQADLGLKEQGPALFVILRLREDRFDDRAHAQLVADAGRAGGTVIALGDVEYQERAQFLSRFAECAQQRLGLPPDLIPEALEALLSLASRPDQRRAPRHEVDVPAELKRGEETVTAAVKNLSKVGALVSTPSPPVLHEQVQLSVDLPAGKVQTPATVVEVSSRGVALAFPPVTAEELEDSLSALTPTEPERLGNYEVLSLLGSGGMGEVYLARVVEGPEKGKEVALKRLPKKRAQDAVAAKRLEAEGRTLAMMKHPNIVRTLDAGVFGGHQCLVMELVEGYDLGQIVRRCRTKKKPLPVDVACYAGKVLLDALTAVHEAKDEHGEPMELVHGDVAPHNLFVAKSGVIKLGDFGHSRREGVDAEALRHGRPSYLSPEALEGNITQAADLWAAAVTLYELVTLEQPFSGRTLSELTEAIRRGQPVPLRDKREECSGPLEAVLKAALEKNPALRFPSAREFAQAVAPHFHPVRTPRAVAGVVRELFG